MLNKEVRLLSAKAKSDFSTAMTAVELSPVIIKNTSITGAFCWRNAERMEWEIRQFMLKVLKVALAKKVCKSWELERTALRVFQRLLLFGTFTKVLMFKPSLHVV